MLFLIGVPGSGKSTFAQRLVSYHGQHDGQHDGQQDGQHKNDQHNDSNGHRVWVRINQVGAYAHHMHTICVSLVYGAHDITTNTTLAYTNPTPPNTGFITL